jgi:hypothetical protein
MPSTLESKSIACKATVSVTTYAIFKPQNFKLVKNVVNGEMLLMRECVISVDSGMMAKEAIFPA